MADNGSSRLFASWMGFLSWLLCVLVLSWQIALPYGQQSAFMPRFRGHVDGGLIGINASKVPRPHVPLFGPGSKLLHYGEETLHWVPNGAGLFSLFLQMRVIHTFAVEHNKSLVIGYTTSPHYGPHVANPCAFFALPDDVRCGPSPHTQHCSNEHIRPGISTGKVPNCITTDALIRPTNHTSRKEMIRAVESLRGIPFALHPEHLACAAKYKAALGITSQQNYTVVHWRRGDQLVSRCRKQLDLSVNCFGSAELADKVRQFSRDLLVFIATNEPQDSPDMKELRKLGFLTFASVPESAGMGKLDVFQVLAIETFLMLDATTFLAWGVSEVNDVIEHERMAHDKSYCIGHSGEEKETGWDLDLTWCHAHFRNDHHRHHKNRTNEV